ncbi:hypothetical protein A5699_02100 [Mycobacterium sp. E802]|nr:hypothetical protein A5699_02100 [Mycobacterium sp. E802]
MDESDFWSTTDELAQIHQWARARYAAPWAVFFAVLLRVAASTGPHVQLPGVIGGRASLNLLCAFVAPSGGGKGISEKVARLAWPASIKELPIGSGEGIAETFTMRGKESEDNERITNAIFNCPEIDILTGLESRQGSTILGTLKAFAMGEQLGSTNASKANSRNVPAHSYRGCLSVSAQPGHTGVIFNDATGGTPQRFLWALTIDPDMPDNPVADPEPLNHALPGLLTRRHDDPDIITEIVYGPDEIRKEIIAAHLARQRGEGKALDGHWMLTRLKTAAAIAIMHHRTVVSDLDWQLSETVMAVSDRTRNWLVQQAQQAARAKIKERAAARAAGEEFYDSSRLETVKRSIIRMLDRDGEQQGNVLRSRLGRKEKRELFEQAIGLLEDEGLVSSAPGSQRGVRYRLSGQGDHDGQGIYSQVKDPDPVGHPDRVHIVTDSDTPSSTEPRQSCPEWLDRHINELRQAGKLTADSFAVYTAAEAACYTRTAIVAAASRHPDLRIVSRGPTGVTWSIDPNQQVEYQPASAWVANYIDSLSGDRADVDKADFRARGEAAGYSWDNLRKAIRAHPRVGVQQGATGSLRDVVWTLRPLPEAS